MNATARYISILALLAGLAATAPAAEITAHCTPEGTVAVRARFWASEIVDLLGVIVERSVVGVCNSNESLTFEPLQVLEGYDMGDYELTFPVPSPDISYRYALKGLDVFGSPVDLGGADYAPTWYAVASCSGDALLLRGRLHDVGLFGRVGVEICGGQCWDICAPMPVVGVIGLDPAEYEPYLGTDTVVSIYGAWDNGPPEVSWGCAIATRLATGIDCSGAVAAEASSWGAVKTRYR